MRGPKFDAWLRLADLSDVCEVALESCPTPGGEPSAQRWRMTISSRSDPSLPPIVVQAGDVLEAIEQGCEKAERIKWFNPA